MKKIAIIFSQAPHGNASSREALDLSLALSDINQISIFFIAEGVFNLLPNQQPDKVLMRNYIATFGMLDLYEIDDIYICQQTMMAYGLEQQSLILQGKLINKQEINALLTEQDIIFKL